mmetsp:Transcript_22258/g.19097  ORF Transcript_22258/g.19097 Transcript_22258/m.19097 type:complete len:182 (-) Transcript_22258:1871-2416(-)
MSEFETTHSLNSCDAIPESHHNYYSHPQQQQQQLMAKKITTPSTPQKKKAARTRHHERTIREVLELIEKWRPNQDGEIRRGKKVGKEISLNQTAELLGVPRKSLDDYMRIIKHAKATGFDFSSHLNERFGVVRAHVNKVKKNPTAINSNEESKNYMKELGKKKLFGIELDKSSKKIHKYGL